MDGLVARYVDPGGHGVPVLLEPEQRPVDDSARAAAGEAAARDHSPAGGDAAVALPPVTCVARFISSGLSGSGEIWSVLRVIWFQDYFAFPVDARVRSQIAALDWDAHAHSWEP